MERQIDNKSNTKAYGMLDKIRRIIDYHADHPIVGPITPAYVSKGLGKDLSRVILDLDPDDERFPEAAQISRIFDKILASGK